MDDEHFEEDRISGFELPAQHPPCARLPSLSLAKSGGSARLPSGNHFDWGLRNVRGMNHGPLWDSAMNSTVAERSPGSLSRQIPAFLGADVDGVGPDRYLTRDPVLRKRSSTHRRCPMHSTASRSRSRDKTLRMQSPEIDVLGAALEVR